MTRHEPCLCLCVPPKDHTASSRNYHSVPKYQGRFYSILMYHRSLYLGLVWYMVDEHSSAVQFQLLCFCVSCLLLLCVCHSVLRGLDVVTDGHGGTTVAFQGLPFVAATNSSVFVRLCLRLCAILNTTDSSVDDGTSHISVEDRFWERVVERRHMYRRRHRKELSYI